MTVEEKNIQAVNKDDPNQTYGEGTIGEQDELGEEILEEQIKHGEKELETLKIHLEDTRNTRERYLEQWETEKRMNELMLEGYERVEPQWQMSTSHKPD